MKNHRFLLTLLLVAGLYHASAQKSVEGLRFSTCLNQPDLPAKFYSGKFLVLDFWATWCGPCIASFPKLESLKEKYKDQSNLVFAAISAESKGMLDTFFHKKKDMLPGILHLVDDSGATWQYFDIRLIPTMLVFAPDGKLVFSGHIEELENCMGKLLKGKNLYKEEKKKESNVDKWEKIKENASFMAIAGPADKSESGGSNSNSNADKSEVSYRVTSFSLTDALSIIGNITSLSITSNDSVKAKQLVSVYYKQLKNNFPEFDKGNFQYQYQIGRAHV